MYLKMPIPSIYRGGASFIECFDIAPSICPRLAGSHIVFLVQSAQGLRQRTSGVVCLSGPCVYSPCSDSGE